MIVWKTHTAYVIYVYIYVCHNLYFSCDISRLVFALNICFTEAILNLMNFDEQVLFLLYISSASVMQLSSIPVNECILNVAPGEVSF